MWITNATQGRLFFVFWLILVKGNPHRNKSLIIIPSDTKGVSIGDKIDKLGLRTSDTAPVYFDNNVRIPQRFRIDKGEGFLDADGTVSRRRIFLS